MDLELLRTFLEVNRHRHFGRAGESLSLTQSAISARIKLLEQQLGVKLFIRHYHDLQLTPEGNRLIRHADMMLSRWRKARQEVALGGAKQQLTVGGSMRLWDIALQDWLHTLRRNYKDMAIIAEVHTPDLLTQRLLQGHLDLAFMLEPAQLETLQVKAVAEIDLALISSVPGTTAATEMENDYIMVDWGLAHAVQHRRLYPDAPEPRLRVAQARMALAHLQELGGSAYLPMRMVQNELKEKTLFRVKGAALITRYAYAVYPLRSGKLELIESCLKYFKRSAKTGNAA